MRISIFFLNSILIRELPTRNGRFSTTIFQKYHFTIFQKYQKNDENITFVMIFYKINCVVISKPQCKQKEFVFRP